MQDLDSCGLTGRLTTVSDVDSLAKAKQGITWLANFHACFLHKPLDKLWPVGTYWHLATRPDEYSKMPASSLKECAHKIDQTLNSARFQTLVHGDAKLANFCFHPETEDTAAVDFQYVGKGAGIKDLVYFLGSCFTSEELDSHAQTLIDFYFDELKKISILKMIRKQ